MLTYDEKEKIRQHIDLLIKSLRTDALSSGLEGHALLDQTVRATVNRLTPESKMLLSGVYNMLMKKTLAKQLYSTPHNQAAFYELDILTELNEKFVFDIPAQINYEESRATLNKWVRSGAVIVVGGVIIITMIVMPPVGIAALIVALMAILLRGGMLRRRGGAGRDSAAALLDAYFQNVTQSLCAWVDSIDAYYDEKISALERKLVEQ
ncbi:hypothetical protein [Selenomonas massiliensis]|uniref:hypothetical protein n=1 Tax=Selenomonas massiliensis TaxID=2058293 RepID=UPI000D10E984|nr:hypothetical protein [Selenomonas massiliensis]